MKTTFGAEFANAAKEGPKLFFAPIVAALKAIFSALSRIVTPTPAKHDEHRPCEGE